MKQITVSDTNLNGLEACCQESKGDVPERDVAQCKSTRRSIQSNLDVHRRRVLYLRWAFE